MAWTDHLTTEEAALHGTDPLIDRLLYRIAYNRRMAKRFHERIPKQSSSPLSETDLKWAQERLQAPDVVAAQAVRARCDEAGSHAWGLIQFDSLIGGDPYVRCSACGSCMGAHDLSLTVAATRTKIDWKFVVAPPDQSSSDNDWYALHYGGYIRPEDILADPEQVRKVREAEAVLASFFTALREAGIRVEM